MEEQNAEVTQTGAETIAKSVFDDMEYAHKQTIEKLTQENQMLKKQVNDYSCILKNISVNNHKEKINSDELVKNLMRGVK